MEIQLPIRVYIEDTDAGGIVYYVNYLKYMERARTEFLRNLGFSKTAIFDDHAMFVVQRVEIDYSAPARLDDALVVSASIARLGRASMIFDQFVRDDQKMLCHASIRVACVDRESLRPMAVPKAIREKLQQSSIT